MNERVALYREPSTDEGTAGVLVYPGGYVRTIEPPWRDNKPNLSCIPTGSYAVYVRESPKYGRVYELRGVKNRSHILLHHGNFAGDRLLGYRTHSAGCILLGRRRGRLYSQASVLNSKTARRQFETAMGFEPFMLEVIE